MIFSDNPSVIDKLLEFSKDLVCDGFKFIRTDPKYAELQIDGTGKGEALVNLAQMYDIPKSQLCGIGNYYNDEPLIIASGIGALVVDAPDDMKHLADYVTKASCDDGALAEFIYCLESKMG